METCEVLSRLGELVNEEYELYNRAGNRGLRAREHELLRRLEVNPGSMLEPLRQRRTLREAGYDSNEAKVRDENPVEGYLQ